MLLLWIIFVSSVLFCYAFMYVCLLMPCGRLLGKGWPLVSRLGCLIVTLSLSHLYPGSGVVLYCIDSWSLPSFLLLYQFLHSCCVYWRQTFLISTNTSIFKLCINYQCLLVYISVCIHVVFIDDKPFSFQRILPSSNCVPMTKRSTQHSLPLTEKWQCQTDDNP